MPWYWLIPFVLSLAGATYDFGVMCVNAWRGYSKANGIFWFSFWITVACAIAAIGLP